MDQKDIPSALLQVPLVSAAGCCLPLYTATPHCAGPRPKTIQTTMSA